MEIRYNSTRLLRNALTRIIVGSCLLFCSGIQAYCQDQFIDVPKGHWAYQAVLELRQKGILLGYPANTIAPVGQPKPMAVYNLSTPQSTWSSLLRALENCDEEGIKVIYPIYFAGCLQHSSRQSMRFKQYGESARRWKYIRIDPQASVLTASGTEFHAEMRFYYFGAFQGDADRHIVMKQTGEKWRVERLSSDW